MSQEILRPPFGWKQDLKEEERSLAERRWLAGFIDFGVSAYLTLSSKTTFVGGRVYHYLETVPTLAVYEANFPEKALALKRYGGETYPETRENKLSGGETTFIDGRITWDKACRAMEQAAPFLLFKSPQAGYFKRWEEAVDREGRVEIVQEYRRDKKSRDEALISLEDRRITKEYLAGVFDACGEVRVEEGGSLRIRILSPNASFIGILQRRFGGSAEKMNPREQTTKTGVILKKRKVFHRWTVSGQEAISFVKTIYPCLWLRREMVDSLLLEV